MQINGLEIDHKDSHFLSKFDIEPHDRNFLAILLYVV
jgi:hypothetical protein